MWKIKLLASLLSSLPEECWDRAGEGPDLTSRHKKGKCVCRRISTVEEGMRRKKRMQCHRGAKAQGKWEHIPDSTTRDWLTLTMTEAVISDTAGILGEKEH